MLILNSKNTEYAYLKDTSNGRIYKGNQIVFERNKQSIILVADEVLSGSSYIGINYYDSKNRLRGFKVNITEEEVNKPITIKFEDGFSNLYNTFISDTHSGLKSIDINLDMSNITSMNRFIYSNNVKNITINNLTNTHKVTSLNKMFQCAEVDSIDLSSFTTENVEDISYMFYLCVNLEHLDVSNFNMSKVTKMDNMLQFASKLMYIKCKQSFKDWCLTNQDVIKLPDTMREGGTGVWEIID